MKYARVFVLVGFFSTICILFVWKYSRESADFRLIERSLSDKALSLFDDDLRALTETQVIAQQEAIAVKRAEIAEQHAKINSRIALIPFYAKMKQISVVAYLSAGVLSVLIIASGGAVVLVKRGTVFHATVKGDTYPVRYHELKSLLPALMGTVQAEIQASYAVNDDAAHARARQVLDDMTGMVKALGGRRGFGSQAIDITPDPAAPALTPPRPEIPAFRSILEDLTPGDPMVLGYDMTSGDANTGTFDRIFSCGIFGLSRSGKTTGLIGLVCQSLLTLPAIEYTVIDPHRKRKESLTAGLPKTKHFKHIDPANFRSGVYAFNRELERRIDKEEDFSARPYVLLIDELPVLIHHEQSATIKAIIGKIAAEGAKAGVYCLISGQDTRLSGAGAARDLLCSSMAYRLSKKQARYLLDDDALVSLHKTVREAKQPGLCLFNSTDDEAVLIQQPRCMPEDVRWVETHTQQKNVANATEFVASSVSDDFATDTTSDATRETQDVLQLSPLLQKVLDYLQAHEMSLSKFCDVAGMATLKGSLSKMLKKEIGLSNGVAQKLMVFFENNA